MKNVTLALPEGLELIVGLHPNSVYLYYEVTEAITLADVHSFKLVLSFPLKTVVYVYVDPIENHPINTRDNNITNNSTGGSIPI